MAQMKISAQRRVLQNALAKVRAVQNVQVRLGRPARLEVVVGWDGDVAKVADLARKSGVTNPVDIVRLPETLEENIQLHRSGRGV